MFVVKEQRLLQIHLADEFDVRRSTLVTAVVVLILQVDAAFGDDLRCREETTYVAFVPILW